MVFKVGLGLDSHRFTDKKKPLILGGVIIENARGLEADSDGDVVLHSLFNAISQALGERSIGFYADSMCKEQGIKDSSEYLKIVRSHLDKQGYVVNNIGVMIEAKEPRMEQYVEKMKRSISGFLKVRESDVGITITSGEGLTSFGRGKGIQVSCVVSLIKESFLRSIK